jgi:cytochrome P450
MAIADQVNDEAAGTPQQPVSEAPPENTIVLAAYKPPEKWSSPLALYRGLRDSLLAIWTAEMFRELIVEKKSIIANGMFLSDPDGIKHVLVDNIANYPKAPLQQRFLKPSLGEGLLTAEGDHWENQRHAANPSFRAAHLSALAPSMIDTIAEKVESWRTIEDDGLVDIHGEMMDLTLEILCQCMFSGIAVDRPALGRAVSHYVNVVGQVDASDFLYLPDWLPSPKIRRAQWSIDYLRNETVRIVEERKVLENPPTDLLTTLIAAQEAGGDNALTDRDIADNIATFLSAGYETTAIALTWSFYLLSQFPWAGDRICEEVERVTGGGPLEPRHLSELVYTRMVFDEAVRLYPPSSIVIRVAAQDDVICGRPVKRGDIVAMSQYVLHRHEKLWDDPNTFDPDRFAREEKANRHRFAYMPFGAGQRSCIGATFAAMEGVFTLATVFREFRFSLEEGQRVEPQLRITLRPKFGMRLRIKKR